jgi:uncharacterized membrane protein YadS
MSTNATMYKVAMMAVGMKAAASAANEDGPLDLMTGYVSTYVLSQVCVCMQVRTDWT